MWSRSDGERRLADVERDRAGFDLGQVEDVVDQPEQVGARVVDGVGELDLLVGQIALGVLGQQLRQDQQAVQRRAQLVAHVGQELGLVLGGQRQLFGLFLQLASWPVRLRGSWLPPACSASRAGAPSPPARRWSAAVRPAWCAAAPPTGAASRPAAPAGRWSSSALPAGPAARRSAAATASAGLRCACWRRSC